MIRSISKIVHSQIVNMGGIILDQPLPSRDIDMVDPFLLIHHWDDKLPGGQAQSQAGVGPHPHRGFSPVTFIFEGGVHHRDSMGIESIIHSGGTQWMNSGSGIVHSERPTKELAELGGSFEIIQFWVNVPAASKLDPPSYQPLSESDTPIFLSDEKRFRVGVVAGQLGEIKGPLKAKSNLIVLRMEAENDGKTHFKIPTTFNCLIYILNGKMTINGSEAGPKQMVIFEHDGEDIELEAKADCRAILLAGEPINEAVVSYGPFVMNTEKEIMEAIKDYQSGKLGELTEVFE